MLALSLAAFVIAWWLGLYLLARDAGRPVMRRTAAGLLAYALAVALVPFDGAFVEHIHAVLAGLPALVWTGVLVAFLSPGYEWRAVAERAWRLAVLPLGVASLVLASVVAGWWQPLSAALVVLPLLAGVLLVVRDRRTLRLRDGIVMLASLFFALGVVSLLVPFGWLPDGVVLGAIGADLAVLGVVVAVSDAFETGESLAPDARRSAVGAGLVALVFGGQVGLVLLASAEQETLRVLAYGVVGAAVAVVTLASPLQAMLDRLVFTAATPMRAERSQLRDAADALPRRSGGHELESFDDDAFVRLVREALRHYGDLGKLVSSPLTGLPAIDKRLVTHGRADYSLDRASELKLMLLESIERLKPAGQEFGTSDEWRYYNALYFPYVAGIKPYRRQPDLSDLDETSRRAFDWLRRYVPERTLYNWQNAAAKVVARDLRTRGWQ